MKYVLIYWVIGCVLLGIGEAKHLERCPIDEIKSNSESIIFVATWPSAIAGALSLPRDFKIIPDECKHVSPR